MKKSRSQRAREVREASQYDAPNLFPEARTFRQYVDLRRYVEDTLVEIARKGELFATDLYNQPQYLVDVAGGIICGKRLDGGRLVNDRVPRELSQYKVKIRSIERGGETYPIEYKNGFRVSQYTSRRDRAHANVSRCEPDWVAPAGEEATEADVFLPEAWVILGQAGEYCCDALSDSARRTRWLYREVKQMPEPMASKPGVGRRKKVA